MSGSKTRQTVALPSATKIDLQNIKGNTGASSDNEVISDALHFRAKLLGRKEEEVFMALAVYDQLAPEIKSGNRLFLEHPDDPKSKMRILFPALG